ncbi:ComF family protein [Piscinibacter terrae]|nr:ComF family protein [Albitalea terrae]
MFLTRLLAGSPAGLVPTQCAVCRDWGRERVCHACRERFMPAMPRCGRCALRVPEGVAVCGDCLVTPPAQDSAIAAVDYAAPWDRLVTQLKFNEALDLSASLASLLLHAWRQAGSAPPDLVLPVPLSAQRLRERGFNQSWELARRLAPATGSRADASLLLRIRDTVHQTAFPIDKRASNVKGAFLVEPRRAAEVRGKTIAIVDDVMTTGATVGEIARTLRQAGAAQVHAWVLARTPAPGE